MPFRHSRRLLYILDEYNFRTMISYDRQVTAKRHPHIVAAHKGGVELAGDYLGFTEDGTLCCFQVSIDGKRHTVNWKTDGKIKRVRANYKKL